MTQPADPQPAPQPAATDKNSNPIGPDDLKALQQNAGSDAQIDRLADLVRQVLEKVASLEKKLDDLAIIVAETSSNVDDIIQDGVKVQLA